MKKFLSSLLIFGQIVFFATSAAQAGFNQDVTVHFRQPVSKQFVQLLSKTFKAPVTQLDADSWRFKVPDLSTTDAYAELFASLPSVADTEPLPMSNSNDLIEPQVNVVLSRSLPNYQGASASPAPTPSAGASASNNGFPEGPVAVIPIPLGTGNQMLVDFLPGTTKAQVDLFYQIYGTRLVRQESFASYRIQLPTGLNPAKAARIFMLYPQISNAQRLYN